MGWLNAFASLNIPDMYKTLAVFHALIFPLNELAPPNTLFMFETLAVSHPLIFELNAVAFAHI